ncbi:four helix bundle protein [Polyangium mundeleinium]|uniref:Four helix bundle protein n=1 Tax=Polyangium mundeleinium TaxID=2995306 RepID=A0ABT5EQP5_9BACT|nr:four helix bundle protein [Polyangium mundeleinium]MDC0744155.1 four helix bundle protein [Polyangium mundeleinium]
MTLRIYGVAIEMLRALRPVIERVGTKDPNLGDQLRRAATNIALNLSEGAYSQGRNERARWHTAMGSAAEVRACLEVAEALGYIEKADENLLDTLDRIVATLHRLTRRS